MTTNEQLTQILYQAQHHQIDPFISLIFAGTLLLPGSPDWKLGLYHFYSPIILPFHYFSEDVRKVILLQHYENNMYHLPKRKPFRLNKYQKVTLMYVFNRAGIRLPFHAIPEFLTLSMLAKHLPKRIIHRKDSMIKAILQQAKKEKNKTAYLYKMVKKLSLDQQIHLLLLITQLEHLNQD